MNSDLRFIFESMPNDTPDLDRYVVESILESSHYRLETGCIVWNGQAQNNSYPIFTSAITGTLPIRPFLYRIFVNPEHNYHRVDRLRLTCNTRRCISPRHLTPARGVQALRQEFASRHRRNPGNKDQTNGDL